MTPAPINLGELERLALNVQASKAAYMALPTNERMMGRPGWWVDWRAYSDAASPEVILALTERLRAAEGALTRLASSEAFDLPQVIDGPLAEEMRQRMDFARQALPPPPDTTTSSGNGS